MNDFEPIQRAWTIFQLCQVEAYFRDHGYRKHAKNVSRATKKLFDLFAAELGHERFCGALEVVNEIVQELDELPPEVRH